MLPVGSDCSASREQALEVADIAVDSVAELAVAIVAAGDLLEGHLAVIGVDVTSEHAVLAGPHAVPDIRRRAMVDRPGQFLDTELTGAGRSRAAAAIGRSRGRGVAVALSAIRIGLGEQLAHGPVATATGASKLVREAARGLVEIGRFMRRGHLTSARIEPRQRRQAVVAA